MKNEALIRPGGGGSIDGLDETCIHEKNTGRGDAGDSGKEEVLGISPLHSFRDEFYALDTMIIQIARIVEEDPTFEDRTARIEQFTRFEDRGILARISGCGINGVGGMTQGFEVLGEARLVVFDRIEVGAEAFLPSRSETPGP